MKHMNVRIPEEKHTAIFQISLKESVKYGKRISMNDIFCDAVTLYLEAHDSGDSTNGVHGHGCIDDTNKTSDAHDITHMECIRGANDIDGRDSISDTNEVDGIRGVNDIDGSDSINDAYDVNGIRDVNDIIDAHSIKSIDGINHANGATESKSGNSRTNVSMAQYIRGLLINGDDINIQTVAEVYHVKATSVSSTKSMQRKKLLSQGLLSE